MKRVSMIGLPIYTLSKYRGIGMGVEALRRLGITEAVNQYAQDFKDLGVVSLNAIETDSGPPNLRNFPQFLQDTESILRAASEIDSDDFVFCLGGECALITGSLAAFRTKFKGQPSMLWMDAHGDFNTQETTTSGFISGMCLAFACGRGPKLSPAIENAMPLLMEENVVHLAGRSLDPLELKAMQSSPLRLYSAFDVRKIGIKEVAEQAAEYLAAKGDWIVCHLDVDSVDPRIIPAVNFRAEGGLTIEEIRIVVDELQSTGKLRVLDLAAYNPLLDHDNDVGNKLVNLTSDIFSTQPFK